MRELCPYASSDDKHSILRHYKSSFEHLGIDCQGKAILNIRADLWFPQNCEINGMILYYLKGETEPFTVKNTFVDRPYPNKNIVSISKRFGRRKTKKGIPLVFDSINELHRIERIEIIWDIMGTNEKVIAHYPIRFENQQQDGIYSLWSYETTVLSSGADKSGLKIIDGRLENEPNMSVYDDFYFLALHDGSISIVEELHRPDSKFRVDFDNLDNLPVSILNAVLHRNIRALASEDIGAAAIYFYYADLLLNDYTA